MSTETMMTEQATTTTEGQAASTAASSQPAEGQQPGAGEQGQQQQQQATEGQPAAGEKPGEGKTGDDQGNTAPESYDFKMPEGQELDSETLAAFTDVAKDLKLSNEAAQKILDKMAPAMEARMARSVEVAKTTWREQATADQEFGGEKMSENLAVAKKAMDEFATPELRKLLNDTGLGNHPEVIRVFYRAGKAISEDSFINGTRKPAGANDDPAKRLFPNQA